MAAFFWRLYFLKASMRNWPLHNLSIELTLPNLEGYEFEAVLDLETSDG
jgi:hypothetical protein